MVKRDESGPFYVVDGCCMTCGMPELIAPELFKLGDDHCYVLRQPETPDEYDKATHAMWSAEVDCIRYRGNDGAFLRRLGENGMAELADDARASDYEYVLRDKVVFRASLRPLELAAAFCRYLEMFETNGARQFQVKSGKTGRTVNFAWGGGLFHPVTFEERLADGASLISVDDRSVGFTSVRRVVDEWLHDVQKCADIVWFSEQELITRTGGLPRPL